MTDAPKTLALDSRSWRAIMLDHVDRLNGLVNAHIEPTPEISNTIDGQLEHMRTLLRGWRASVPKPTPNYEQMLEAGAKEIGDGIALNSMSHPHSLADDLMNKMAAKVANGGAIPAEGPARKKPGWPLGKPRGKRTRQNPRSV